MTLDALIQRDGTACVWCGRRPWRSDLTIEHLVPRARSGRTVPENLTIACRPCNRRRGTRPVVAFVRAQLESGVRPRTDAIAAGLDRLSRSPWPDLAAYGRRQMELLERIATDQRPRSPGEATPEARPRRGPRPREAARGGGDYGDGACLDVLADVPFERPATCPT